jgi:hypothetical protein
MKRKSGRNALQVGGPYRHPDHPRPVTRRQFVAQGFLSGAATVLAPSIFGMFANPRAAQAALSADLEALKQSCGIAVQGAGKIPFICFDLSGGSSMAGSNVLTGGQGGQRDFLSVAGYGTLGLPGDMVPNAPNPGSATNDFIESRLGLLFHLDSAFVRGILERVSVTTAANVNGAVIPARSENDTSNNPHNPMYGINRAGADGELLTLIGSVSSDSGGNSMAPAAMVDPAVRPTKVSQTSDVTGLVDTGKLVGLLDQDDAVRVMESIERISSDKLARVDTGVTRDAIIKDMVRCNYVKAADLTDRYGDPSALNPTLDPDIVGPAGIFTQAEFDNESEFRKTAAVMKLVINGYAGAGTIDAAWEPASSTRRAAACRSCSTCSATAPSTRTGPSTTARTGAASSTGRATTSRPPRRSSSSTTPQAGRSSTRATAGRRNSTSSSGGSARTGRSRRPARRLRTTSTCWSRR